MFFKVKDEQLTNYYLKKEFLDFEETVVEGSIIRTQEAHFSDRKDQ